MVSHFHLKSQRELCISKDRFCSCFLSPKVPSGYFLTDAYLYLDLLLNKRLFKPKAADPKENKPAVTRAGLAGLEGVKAKKLLGGLRTLWRSSQVGAHDPRVVDLKNYLQPSPRKIPAALREAYWFEMQSIFLLGSLVHFWKVGGAFFHLFWGAFFETSQDAEPAEPIPTATPEASPEPEPAASSPEGSPWSMDHQRCQHSNGNS